MSQGQYDDWMTRPTVEIVEINGWIAMKGLRKYIAHKNCKPGDRIVWEEDAKEPWKTPEPRKCGTCRQTVSKLDFVKLLCFLRAHREHG